MMKRKEVIWASKLAVLVFSCVMVLTAFQAINPPGARADPPFATNVGPINDDGIPTTGPQNYPDIAVNSSGVLFAAWNDARTQVQLDDDVMFSTSDDGGATWSANGQVGTSTSGAQNAPSIAIDSYDNINVAFQDVPSMTESDIFFSRSTDGGSTWSTDKKVNDDGAGNPQDSPDMVVDSNGYLYIVWRDWRNMGDTDIYFSKSTNGGVTWSTNLRVNDDPAGNSQSDPSIAVDVNGYIYVAWSDKRQTSGYDVFFSKSTDGGNTFGDGLQNNNDIIVNSNLDDDTYQWHPSIAVDADSNIYIAFEDEQLDRLNSYDIFFSKSTDGGASWSADVKINDDLPGNATEQPDLVSDASGNLYVVWQDGRNGDLDIYFSMSGDKGATWGTNLRVVDDTGPSTHKMQIDPKLALGSGNVYVIWADYRNLANEPDIWFSKWANSAPSLTNGYVFPAAGPIGSFRYNVTYSDPDNDPASAVFVYIYRDNRTADPGNPHSMTAAGWVGTPGDYTQGRYYEYDKMLSICSDYYEFRFSGSDGKATVWTDYIDGPDVCAPAAPDLTEGTVAPPQGPLGTVFTFQVNYSDPNNNPPIYVQVNIDSATTPGLATIPMTGVDPGDTLYRDGKYYTAQFTPWLTEEHYCTFEASDGTFTVWSTEPCEFNVTGGGPQVPPDPPENLWLEKSGANVILHWDIVPEATSYNIYYSSDRFAAWSLWSFLGSTGSNSYVASGHVSDTTDYFYIVRSVNASGESTNSTMGAKAHFSFALPLPGMTDINWFSLPFVSEYTKASDITSEIGTDNISMIGKWDPSKQRAITYTYIRGKWRGHDFDINPGEGIFIGGLQQGFEWAAVGTDFETSLNFNYYPRHVKNINWISVPYTGMYDSASSIVADIEISTPPTKIVEVGKWDPVTQTSIRYYFDSGSWTGTDFAIEPGDGIYIQVIWSFGWTIELVIPTVP